MRLLLLIMLVVLCLAGPVFSGYVDVFDIELQTGKLVKGGQLVTANVVTSYRPLTNKILKDLAVSTITDLKKKYPDCKWFHVYISDDRRMLEAKYYLAIADYKEGNLEVTGGVPSDAEIKEYRKQGIPVIKPDETGIAVFSEISRVKLLYGNKGKDMTDQEICRIVSKKMRLPLAKVKKYLKGVGWYYMAKCCNTL